MCNGTGCDMTVQCDSGGTASSLRENAHELTDASSQYSNPVYKNLSTSNAVDCCNTDW